MRDRTQLDKKDSRHISGHDYVKKTTSKKKSRVGEAGKQAREKKKLAKGAKRDEGDALLRVGKVENVAGRTRELRRQPSGSGATFCWPPGMVRTKITWSGANCA